MCRVVSFGNWPSTDLDSESLCRFDSLVSFDGDKASSLLETFVLMSLGVFVLSSNSFSSSVLGIPARSQTNVSYNEDTVHVTTMRLEAERCFFNNFISS